MMKIYPSRRCVLTALAGNGGELVANGLGYLPSAQQLEFFGLSLSAPALSTLVTAMETDDLVVRERYAGGRRTISIRLTPIGWEVVRERGLFVEPEPEPEPAPEPVVVIEDDEDESELIATARRLLDVALSHERDLQTVDALHERLAETSNALEKALGARRLMEIQLRDALHDLRLCETRERHLRIQVGRVERLLAEAQAVPRDSERYRVKLDELARLMEEKPKVGV